MYPVAVPFKSSHGDQATNEESLTSTTMATSIVLQENNQTNLNAPRVIRELVKYGLLRLAIRIGEYPFSSAQWDFLLSLLPVSIDSSISYAHSLATPACGPYSVVIGNA